MRLFSIVGVAFLIPSVAGASVCTYITLYVTELDPPAVVAGANYSFDLAATWDEQQCVNTAAVPVDMVPNFGTVTGTSSAPVAGSVAAGKVDVHMVHYYAEAATPITASIKFDGSIVGVVFTTLNLAATDDSFAPSGTTYMPWTGRGIDTVAGDVVSFDGNILTFTFNQSNANSKTVEVRVFTKRSLPGDYDGNTFTGAGADWAKFSTDFFILGDWKADINCDLFVDGIDHDIFINPNTNEPYPPPC